MKIACFMHWGLCLILLGNFNARNQGLEFFGMIMWIVITGIVAMLYDDIMT
jgi:hypothetical protein